MNNFKIVFETHLNSRTNTETLVQLIEQTLYRHPQYCTEMRSYLGSLQQANILSLDMYAALIAEIEQFEEQHISITFEQWRTQPETLRFLQRTSPIQMQYYWLVGGTVGALVLTTSLWLWQTTFTASPELSPPPPSAISETAPPSPNRLIAQNVIHNDPPISSISTGDVEPALPVAPPVSQPIDQDIEKILKNCQTAFAAQRLTSGKGETALDCYRKVLTIDANNQAAKEGLSAIEKQYGDWALRAIQKKQWEKVREYARTIATINPHSPLLHTLQQKLPDSK